MSDHEAAFSNNRANAQLSDAIAASTSIIEREGYPRGRRDDCNRVLHILSTLQLLLRSADPALVSLTTLDQLSHPLTQVNNTLNQFRSGTINEPQLNQVILFCEQLLPTFPLLRSFQNGKEVEAARRSLKSLRTSTRKLTVDTRASIDRVESTVHIVNDNLAVLIQDIERLKERAETVIAGFQDSYAQAESQRQDQHANAQESRATEYLIEKERIRTDWTSTVNSHTAIIEEYERKTSATIGSIKKSHEGLRASAKSTFDELMQTSKTLNQEAIEEFRNQASNAIFEIELQRDKAKELLNIIATDGMTANFGQEAKAALRSARKWHIISIAAMSCLVVFSIYAYMQTFNGDFHWGAFSGRVFVAATFGLLVAYAAKQADKLSEVSRRCKRIELELASVGPFIADLPEEMQHDIINMLTDRMFGYSSSVIDSTTSGTDAKTGIPVDSAFKVLIDALRSGANGGRSK